MKKTYVYETVEVYPETDEKGDKFVIVAPSFMAEVREPLSFVLKAIPNMLQEPDKGEWETYSTILLNGKIVFLVRKSQSNLIVAGAFG